MLDRHRPKLLRNATGRKARLVRALENGNMEIPAGAVVEIKESAAWSKLNIRSEPCPHCGVRVLMSRVDVGAVEFLSVMKGDEDAV